MGLFPSMDTTALCGRVHPDPLVTAAALTVCANGPIISLSGESHPSLPCGHAGPSASSSKHAQHRQKQKGINWEKVFPLNKNTLLSA